MPTGARTVKYPQNQLIFPNVDINAGCLISNWNYVYRKPVQNPQQKYRRGCRHAHIPDKRFPVPEP